MRKGDVTCPECGAGFSIRFDDGSGRLSGMAMTTDYLAAAENTAQSLAPNEVITLLIGSTVEEVERTLVVQTLARCNGNRTYAARVLGLSVRTLRNKIRVYTAEGIEVPAHRDQPQALSKGHALPARRT
jgi:DNA-binding NtrC family response regulator